MANIRYSYDSPLDGYRGLDPLSSEKITEGPDAKALVNPTPNLRSKAYTEFPSPITNGSRGGFDVHVYYNAHESFERTFATELHERIRREFPELRIYKLFDTPISPHPVPMFEVNIHTPEQFGAFVSWLVIHRGPLSALLHPNTDDEFRDHTQRATWLGEPYPLITRMLKQGTAQAS